MVNEVREAAERRREAAQAPPPPRCLSLAHRYEIQPGAVLDAAPDLTLDYSER